MSNFRHFLIGLLIVAIIIGWPAYAGYYFVAVPFAIEFASHRPETYEVWFVALAASMVGFWFIHNNKISKGDYKDASTAMLLLDVLTTAGIVGMTFGFAFEIARILL